MENNSLLMIVMAFILGCMASQMMKSMCGSRLVEGDEKITQKYNFVDCKSQKQYHK